MTLIDLNSMFASTGDVYLAPGVYQSPGATVPQGCKLVMHPLAVLSPAAGASDAAFLTLNDYSRVEGGSVSVPLSVFPNMSAIRAIGKTGIVVRDVTIPSSGYIGVDLNQCHGSLVDNVTVGEASVICIRAYQCDRTTIRGCYASNAKQGHGIQCESGANNVVEGCTANGTWAFGINLHREQYSKVLACHTFDTRPEGINLDACLQCQLISCSVTWYGGSTWPSIDFGISINGNDVAGQPQESCCYNIVANNTVYGCAKSGIALAGNSSFNTVTGNTVLSVNGLGERLGSGILIYSLNKGAHQNLIGLNMLAGGAKMKYGVNDASGNTDNILGTTNNIVGATVGATAHQT